MIIAAMARVNPDLHHLAFEPGLSILHEAPDPTESSKPSRSSSRQASSPVLPQLRLTEVDALDLELQVAKSQARVQLTQDEFPERFDLNFFCKRIDFELPQDQRPVLAACSKVVSIKPSLRKSEFNEFISSDKLRQIIGTQYVTNFFPWISLFLQI
jgi:hypothetical protein